MKTSTYILSSSQKWIFAVVIILAILFAGCDDSPTGGAEGITTPIPPVEALEGYWIEIARKGQMDIPWLNLTSTSGTYNAYSVDNNNVVMHFEYEKANETVLRITTTKHTVNGKLQPIGEEEDIFYRLNGNTLRIFGRNFIRAGNRVELF